ncbi:MAG TPA: TMEM165/GDT1 family protein [Bacillota bacterium]
MNPFWLSLGMIFLAELGDKTQLVALTLAARYRAGVVLAGVFVATLVVHVISVALGGLAGGLLPIAVVRFVAGLAFIAFGLWTLRGDSLEERESRERPVTSPFWLVTITFFLAEFGDKTMLSTVTLAAGRPPIPVWLGSTVGMVLSDGLAVLVGQLLGARLPERAIRLCAALVFFGFGLVSTIQGGLGLSPVAWAAGVLGLGLPAFLLFRRRGSEAKG